MANNRMFLVNHRLRCAVPVAKYYPSTGWYRILVDWEMPEDNDNPDGDAWVGSTDWVVVYESDAGYNAIVEYEWLHRRAEE